MVSSSSEVRSLGISAPSPYLSPHRRPVQGGRSNGYSRWSQRSRSLVRSRQRTHRAPGEAEDMGDESEVAASGIPRPRRLVVAHRTLLVPGAGLVSKKIARPALTGKAVS